MAKVGAKLGGTHKTSQFENIRPELEILDIDDTQDVDAQLIAAKQALRKTWDAVVSEYSEQVLEQSPYNMDDALKAKLNKKFKEIAEDIENLKKNQLKEG